MIGVCTRMLYKWRTNHSSKNGLRVIVGGPTINGETPGIIIR